MSANFASYAIVWWKGAGLPQLFKLLWGPMQNFRASLKEMKSTQTYTSAHVLRGAGTDFVMLLLQVHAMGMENSTAAVPISVFWLVPQYFIIGAAEILVNIGTMELFYSEVAAEPVCCCWVVKGYPAMFMLKVCTVVMLCVFSLRISHSNVGCHNSLTRGCAVAARTLQQSPPCVRQN